MTLTQSQREAYYSAAHWLKQLQEVTDYNSELVLYRRSSMSLSRYKEIFYSLLQRKRYFHEMALWMGGVKAYDEIRHKGELITKVKDKGELIINGVNYGLMLEGAKAQVFKRIDENFKTALFKAQVNAICYGYYTSKAGRLKPAPKFAKGGPAMVGEKGREIFFESGRRAGKYVFTDYGRGRDSTVISFLESGKKVLPFGEFPASKVDHPVIDEILRGRWNVTPWYKMLLRKVTAWISS